MYCPNCGGANADSYGHCTHCGAKLPADHYQPSARPSRDAMLAQSRPTAAVPTLAEQETVVYKSIQNLCTGPVFIVALICYCASIISQLIDINSFNLLAQLDFGSGSSAVFGHATDEITDFFSGYLSGFMFLLMIPGILTAVGLVITFFSAQSYRESGKISAVGLRIIWVLQIISLVFICLLTLMVIFILMIPLLGSDGDGLVMFLFLIIVGALGLSITYSAFTIKTISTAMHTLDTGVPDSGVSGFVGVMCCISGASSVFSALGTMNIYFNLSGFASGAAMILFGVMIFQYKNLMSSLEAMSYSTPTFSATPSYSSTGYSPAPSRPEPPASGYIPTWKRIQMEEENNR